MKNNDNSTISQHREKQMIEPLMMGLVLATSVAFPIVYKVVSKKQGCLSVFVCIIASLTLSHLIFYFFSPEYHFGSTHSIAIMMYLFISSVVTIIVTGLIFAYK